MRRAPLVVLASMTLVGIWPASVFAQSAIVDLSKPPTGKSQFVLNSDFTAADLGVVRMDDDARKASPSAASDWCANGCKMLPPQAAAAVAPLYRGNIIRPAAGSGTNVVVVNGNTREEKVAAAAPKRSSGFRIGRRR